MRKDDQEPNRMDFFKATHYSNNKEWTTVEAKTAYEKMVELRSTLVEEGAKPKTIDDIMDEVLDRIDLEKHLKNKEDELNACKSNFEVLQTQMDAMRSALLAAGIQVPPLQFPAPNNTSNSSSSRSQPTQNLD
ncbi:hypothetical protein V6N12_049195 [Hibiscus sabdariffa]|uniref:Uncharacterized protein n=1 Tax=Hibiscus sabdariffa TaxID=183260 RepID=A0ABR2EJV3_9ROSI